MSILKRVRDITLATFNEKLEKSEDPVRLIDRFLIERQTQIADSERLYRQCWTHAQTLRQQYLSAEEIKLKREQQALLALKAGEEEIARITLQEKLKYEEQALQYRTLYEQSHAPLLELEEQLGQLKAEYNEVNAKRSYYQARMESVRLQRQMNERLHGTAGNSPNLFNRLDDHVTAMEAETKAIAYVRQITREVAYAGAAVNSAIEMELKKLKQRLAQEGDMKQ